MSRAEYRQVVALRQHGNPAERRILLQQAIRELVPWDRRPFLVQADDASNSFPTFRRRDRNWFVMVDAEPDVVGVGSESWQRFVDVLRQRVRGEIGLFCALGTVGADVVADAASLNRDGILTLILSGDTWDELCERDMPISDLLDYMIVKANSQAMPQPLNVVNAQRWTSDQQAAVASVTGICQRVSATFLRRHQLPHHADLYIPRAIDHDVDMAVRALQPAKLMERVSSRWRRRLGDEAGKKVTSLPPQILVVRDASGSGKTTLAVQLASGEGEYFAAARAATQSDIDDLTGLFDALGEDCGLKLLATANRPLVYVVDSMDEAQGQPNKHKELLGLVKLIEELNGTARRHGYRAFPFVLVLTVRDEYWDRWLPYLEGRHFTDYKRRISRFSRDQVDIALTKYAAVYGFSVVGRPASAALDVLAVPFNMLVFAEANMFQGPLELSEALTDNVIGKYFERKRENVTSRGVPGLNGNTFMELCEHIAMGIVGRPGMSISRVDLVELISAKMYSLRGSEDEAVLLLLSEQILTRGNEEGTNNFRFRHARFVESLIAYYAVRVLARERHFAVLATVMATVEKAAAVVSIFGVHNAIRFICEFERQDPDLLSLVSDFYSTSQSYMAKNLLRLRSEIAQGLATKTSELQLIYQSASAAGENVAWGAFFVLAAAANQTSARQLVEAFTVAWQASAARGDRWKLIQRMADRGEMLNENVVLAVVESTNPKDWEVFLGWALRSERRAEAADMLTEWCPNNHHDLLDDHHDEGWGQARGLLKLLLSGQEFIEGTDVSLA